MSLTSIGRYLHVGQIITVVGMEHGPVADGYGEIIGHAAPDGLLEVNAFDPAVIIEPYLVVDTES